MKDMYVTLFRCCVKAKKISRARQTLTKIKCLYLYIRGGTAAGE